MEQQSPYSPPIKWPSQGNRLPKEIFNREDVFREELKRIFMGPEWHLVAHVAEVPKVGDFKQALIGQAPVLIIRGQDGVVRTFQNSCSHRGTQLAVEWSGNFQTNIVCPYHRWSFGLDGQLLGAPGMERFPAGWDKSQWGMVQLKSEVINGCVFATFAENPPPVQEYLGDDVTRLIEESFGPAEDVELVGYQKVIFSSNWKECTDNEGYHAPLLHSAFRLLQWQGGGGSQQMSEYGHKYVQAPLKPAKAQFLNDSTLVEFQDEKSLRKSTILGFFPSSVITKHLDTINLRFVMPLSSGETELHYAYFRPRGDDPALREHTLHQASNLLGPSGLISLEDGAVYNRLHRGSFAPADVVFQKGWGWPEVEQNDEVSNLMRWERYRKIMEFERD